MRRILVCAILVLVSAPLSNAQKAGRDPFPRFEIFGGYSSIETNNHTFRFSPGFNASNTDFDEGARGFEVAITRNLNRYFGIMGDFSAHFSLDQGPIPLFPLHRTRRSTPGCSISSPGRSSKGATTPA